MIKHLIPLLLCSAFSPLTFAAPADTPATPAASTFPGHYSLQGVTEVGSELLLKQNGKFEWMLSYGNQDMQAAGSWRASGQDVTLAADVSEKPVQFKLRDEADQHFKKGAEKGVWIATVGVEWMGPVGGMEARFEAQSGKTADTVSRENGDAIVTMPASEQWTRLGLRRQGAHTDFQWLAIPPARACARIAAVNITNPEVLGGAPFKQMTLRREAGGLRVAEPDNPLARGLYVATPSK